MKVKVILLVIFWSVFFISCDNRTIEESEIFLKEFEGSQRVMGAKIYFQKKSKFYTKAVVITEPIQHPGLYPSKVSAMILIFIPEKKVRKIYPEGPEALIRVIKSKSLIATSINEARDIARRFERVNKEKLQFSFIPKDEDVKRKLFSVKKGDIIEVEGWRGNLLIESLREEGKKSLWCPKLERNKYIYVEEIQILDSL